MGAINPPQPVTALISTGPGSPNPDGTPNPTYGTPGTITASIGGIFACTSIGTTLYVNAIDAGSLQAGDAVSGSDGVNALPAGCMIVEQLTGAPGGIGSYEMTAAASPSDLGPAAITSSSTVLDVGAIGLGTLQAGQALADTGSLLSAGTVITAQLSGTVGGVGLYSVNQPQMVATEAMTTSMTLLAQIQAMTGRDLRQVESLNLQGTLKGIYVTGDLSGLVRVALKGGDLIVTPDGQTWLIAQVLEPWSSTAGWTKAVMVLQNGS